MPTHFVRKTAIHVWEACKGRTISRVILTVASLNWNASISHHPGRPARLSTTYLSDAEFGRHYIPTQKLTRATTSNLELHDYSLLIFSCPRLSSAKDSLLIGVEVFPSWEFWPSHWLSSSDFIPSSLPAAQSPTARQHKALSPQLLISWNLCFHNHFYRCIVGFYRGHLLNSRNHP
jgi:hypothetical protein